MKRIFMMFTLGVLTLTACMVPPTAEAPVPVETQPPVETMASPTPEPTATEPAAAPTETMPQGKLPAAPFDSRTYINNEIGFALDYPANWTVNEMVIGDRGAQVQFVSSADLAEAPVVPEGATRVNVAIYQWDPKNDLTAFIDHQKSAWDASGLTIVEEEPLTLELGLPATRFLMQTPDANVVFLITAVGDRYLVLSGEGNLNLATEIMQRLRPVSP